MKQRQVSCRSGGYFLPDVPEAEAVASGMSTCLTHGTPSWGLAFRSSGSYLRRDVSVPWYDAIREKLLPKL
jgi:hypothetical protein